MLARTLVGSPGTVRDALAALMREVAPDELIVASAIHDHDARLRSYELLAGVAIPSPAGEQAGGARA
jgi:alkanesulfonate monooxygenase SsuD/methylene tetrahydromethanopterin reductase-like flavin-dependent oxidoreductase (luciferase family)